MNDKKKILLIDDEADFCFFVKANLENTGAFDVITRSTAREGIRLARIEKPDLIFLDIVMPEISGDEVAMALFDHPETNKIPIIFLTALITKTETGTEILKEVGGRSFLAKPVRTRHINCEPAAPACSSGR